jgi:hypothetical protein
MKQLSKTWFADGYIDFELKKYTLLAYLQEINGYFNQSRLYPQLSDVIFHFNNLIAFRNNKKHLQEQFPKKFTGVDIKKLELLFENILEDNDLMKELEEIIEFSTEQLKKTIEDGTQIYEFVNENIRIEPVGLTPLDLNEGYFFLSKIKNTETEIYYYRIKLFEKHDEKYRSIMTDHIDTYYRGFSTTYQSIKSQLIKKRKEMPNPAVYSIETEMSFPLDETLLPIAKRRLVKYIVDNV